MQPYDDTNNYRRLIKPLLLVVFIFVVLVGAYEVYKSRHFHVVSTTPSTSDVATVAPYLKINFNKALSAKGLSVSSSYSVAKSYRVDGKSLDVTLATPMTATYPYYVKINIVYDTAGQKITNQTFNFTPQSVDWQSLSKDQQNTIVQQQANQPRSISDLTFNGFDTFSNDGLSAYQLSTLEQEFFNFDKNASTVTVNSNNVNPVPHDPNSASTMNAINFVVAVDSKTYNAAITYSANLIDIRLVLTNPQDGSQAYDSGGPNPSAE